MARVTRMTKRRLGELLRAEGLVTEDQVKLALVEQRKSNLFLGEALVKLGFVTEDAIASTISQQFGLPYISIDQYNVGKEVLDLFPVSMLREYQFMPIDKIGSVLVIVGAGLMNHDVLDELERMSGCRVCQYVGTWKDIYETIQKLFKDRKTDAGAPAPDNELSSLGNLLLGEGEAAEEPVEAEAENDLAAAVKAVTGTSSSVLEEALAAVEGPKKGAEPAAAAKPAAPKPAAASSARLGAASGRLSAFAGGKAPNPAAPGSPSGQSGIKKAIPGSPVAGTPQVKEEAKKPADGSAAVPKGGLLGFLKK